MLAERTIDKCTGQTRKMERSASHKTFSSMKTTTLKYVLTVDSYEALRVLISSLPVAVGNGGDKTKGGAHKTTCQVKIENLAVSVKGEPRIVVMIFVSTSVILPQP